MALQDKLDAIRTQFHGKAPTQVVAALEAANADLAATGQAARALKVGDSAPLLTLPGPDARRSARASSSLAGRW